MVADSKLTGILIGGIHASRPAATAVVAGSTYSCTTHGLEYQSDGATWSTRSTFGSAASGSITASGYTQSTARILGRTTASTGAIEEISVGTGLSLSAGSLTATGGSSYDPITAAFGAADTAYEFDTNDLSAFTQFGTPDNFDADTTIPDHLYVADNDSTWCGGYVSASPAFTAVLKVDEALLEQNYQWIGLACGNSGWTSYVVAAGRFDTAPSSRGIRQTSDVQIAATTGILLYGRPFWLAIRAASSTDVSLYASRDGLLWAPIIVADNPGFTVAKVGLAMWTNVRIAASIDYLRIWNSAKTFPV